MQEGLIDQFPRPSGWRPGGSSPWAEADVMIPSSLPLSQVIEGVQRASSHDIPFAMPWATTRDASELSRVISASTLRSAAVLLVLFEEEGETRLVLTRRSHELALHRGQLAFPGGMIEEGETPLEAALREAHEEVGLDLLTITVVGELTKVVTLPRSLIYPVVVSLPERPTLEAAPEEVAYVFDVALKDALRPEAYWEEWWPGADHAEWMEDDEHFPICFFDLGGDHVAWGPTGRILRELLCASLRIEDGRDW